MAAYVDLHRLFKYGEAIKLCKKALGCGPRNTRELAPHVMAAKGLSVDDKVLVKSVAAKLIHSLRQHIAGAGLRTRAKSMPRLYGGCRAAQCPHRSRCAIAVTDTLRRRCARRVRKIPQSLHFYWQTVLHRRDCGWYQELIYKSRVRRPNGCSAPTGVRPRDGGVLPEASKPARHLKAELKRAAVTYEELAERLIEHGFEETKASIANKLARATVPAHFFLASLPALGREGLRLEEN